MLCLKEAGVIRVDCTVAEVLAYFCDAKVENLKRGFHNNPCSVQHYFDSFIEEIVYITITAIDFWHTIP